MRRPLTGAYTRAPRFNRSRYMEELEFIMRHDPQRFLTMSPYAKRKPFGLPRLTEAGRKARASGMKKKVPSYLLLEDERAAYTARYHDITPEPNEIRRIVIKAYGGMCACCGHDGIDELTLDHIEPVLGGNRKKLVQLWRENFPKDNLQVLCVACNTLKGSSRACLCPHAQIARHFTHYAGLIIQASLRALPSQA